MRVLVWHVHGSWTTAFVQGPHTYLLPVLPDRGPDGRGRARTWDWPPSAQEVSPAELADADVDVVVLQRPAELADSAVDVVVLQRPEELDGLAERWLGGRRPGRDLPAVYLEHNAPQGRINELAHPAAGAPGVVLVHVTHFNDLFWDAGTTPTRVIEHGIVDPGYRYTGELPRAAVAVNEPVRRARVTGTDLLGRFASAVDLDVFGMRVDELDVPGVTTFEDLPQERLHDELARRRVYVHTSRWTSLGLSLLEAMHLGMPVVALATTEAVRAVPPEAGILSTCAGELVDAARRFVADPGLARAHGDKARAVALGRYGLERFLTDWDELLEEVAS